jgi:acyl transferase domain-containing protein/acyl-CoA synthetase (AMP-forming)/AMP-acid ligase II/acyl carrier protein
MRCTWIEVVEAQGSEKPHEAAYTFLADGEREAGRLTFSDVERQARAVAARLQDEAAPGERALLLHPPGLDFVTAFLGCLYAGIIAVPVYPPRNNRNLGRLTSIARDCRPRLVLSTAASLRRIEPWLEQEPALAGIERIATDELPGGLAATWRRPSIGPDTLAFLQYTSGSTADPKGVMVSHANLLHNEERMRVAADYPERPVAVSWLPVYHDLGLIGAVLQSLYTGIHCVLMAPAAFLQQPVRWLRAISHYRGTTSGAPNFAWDLCLRAVSEEQKETLDLSSWAEAFTGAEPIRAETIERFSQGFAGCGFRRSAFFPCYGLAEATLFVTGARQSPTVIEVDAAALERHEILPAAGTGRRLVGCGHPWLEDRVEIVDAETGERRPPGSVGEIWVAGPSVAAGYWNQPEATERDLRARLAGGTGTETYLRTGDLGFLAEGELFVTGRLKDLLILNGRNHYPQDIELTVERSHPALRPASGAAFAVEAGGQERLAVVQELLPRARLDDPVAVFRAVRAAVAEEHEIALHRFVLVEPGSVPKTSSGKIQRRATRQALQEGRLAVVHTWDGDRGEASSGGAAEPVPLEPAVRRGSGQAGEIRAWLLAHVAGRLGLDPAAVDSREPLAHLGFDSVAATRLAGELESWLGRPCSPTLVYEHPSIDALAAHLGAAETAAKIERGGERRGASGREPVAIVGIGCRFPGASGPEELWTLLAEGRDAIREVPAERWAIDEVYDPDPEAPGRVNTRWGGFLDGVDRFDAGFFGIAPREAARMDPQQRLLLEAVWEALEDAGETAERLAGSRTGVWVGISGNEYGQRQLGRPRLIDAYAGTGNALSIAANRISYLLDLQGPSLAVDTACSSSLVAVHLACRSLWDGDADLALAAGSNLILTPAVTMSFTKAGVMAPDGRCKTFDARADGYVRGEGVGAVVLKPLSRALADGDPIYAVIRGGAVNQDGRSNGLMAPNPRSQEEVIREACADAGVAPGRVSYVEAHGTGTALGDPIEVKALAAVLAEGRPVGSRCALGSIKTNIGHLEAAAGIAGLIKVALALRHRAIPPNLHFERPNPLIPFAETPLFVQTGLGPFPEAEGRAVAGVSSFGFGGTNAHLILEEAPAPAAVPAAAPATTADPEVRPQLLPLSARAPEALRELAERFSCLLSTLGPGNLPDFAFSAARRRSHHDERAAVVARTPADATEALQAFLRGEASPGLAVGRATGQPPRVVFVCPGQGGQWPGMGRGLLTEPVFRETFERCEQAIRPYLGPERDLHAESAEIDAVQPALFALQVSLAALWRSWGIEPCAVVGHSLGEVAAAAISGALSLADAAKVICRRSALLRRVAGRGAMAHVELPLAEARRALAGREDRLSIAASNSPASTVLAGDEAALDEVLTELAARGVLSRRIRVDVASHSPQVDPLQDDLLRALDGISPGPAAIRFVSTVEARPLAGPELGPEYWARNLREPVLLAPVVAALLEEGADVFVELGPHPVLGPAIEQSLRAAGRRGLTLPSMRRQEELSVTLESLGRLYVEGGTVDWRRVHPTGRPLPLPSYPWQRERHWLDLPAEPPAQITANETAGGHPLLGRHLWSSEPGGRHFWETELVPGRLPFLTEHRLQGAAVIPATVYVEMALAAGEEVFGAGACELADLSFTKALFVTTHDPRTVQLVLAPEPGGGATFRISSRPAGARRAADAWVVHASGRMAQMTRTSRTAPEMVAAEVPA